MKRSANWIFLSAVLLVLALGVACSEQASENALRSSDDTAQDRLSSEGGEGVPAGEAPAPDGSLNGSDGTSSGAAPNPAQLQTSLDRKIVQTSSIDIEVEEVGRQFQELVALAETSGGFVLSSMFSNAGDDQVADITIRVPAERYQDVLSQLRGMGEVRTENSTASDVTEEFTDLESRMRQLRAEERQYLDLLGEAQNIEQILLVQDRLNDVIAQIEQIQGRINLLNNLSDLATITAHLRPIAAGTGSGGGALDPLEAAENAWDASLDTLRALAVVVVAIAAYSWWLVPLAVAGYAGGRWLSNRKSRPSTGASV